MTSKLLRQVWSRRQLTRSWHVIRENGRFSKSEDILREIEKFAEDETKNINSLSSHLSGGTFRFRPSKGVLGPKVDSKGKKDYKKTRPIVIAKLEERIVQRSLLETLVGVEALRPYAENPFSFGGIRKSGDGLSAVPAAVEGVLRAIGEGGEFVAFADIRKFFTKISKEKVLNIISNAVNDDEFMGLVSDAVKVELDNMAQLKEKSKDFPTEDVGVAQGNCLSPLLGNIILHQFDSEMNKGDCCCIRYIDDFIIIAPNKRAAVARMKKAKNILLDLGMSLSEEKSSKEPQAVEFRFTFLGVEFANGLIRPGQKARYRLIDNVKENFKASLREMRKLGSAEIYNGRYSLLQTMRRVDGIIVGWGKHFRFCNDIQILKNLESEIGSCVREYLGAYRSLRETREGYSWEMLGIQRLGTIELRSLQWPSKKGINLIAAPTLDANISLVD